MSFGARDGVQKREDCFSEVLRVIRVHKRRQVIVSYAAVFIRRVDDWVEYRPEKQAK